MYIVDIKRTPVGKFLGSLSHLTAPELAKPLFDNFLERYEFLKNDTDEIILGNVLSAGVGMNPARIAALHGGMSNSVPAYTINQVCGSGLNAIHQGFRAISMGDASLVIAGGMESMSQAPHVVRKMRSGVKYGSSEILDTIMCDGLYCTLSGKLMGDTAEILAKKYKISRARQDAFSLQSHKRAIAALKDMKKFFPDLISVDSLVLDEGPRSDTSLEKLSALKPIFDANGSVTAGNASSMNDGAALALLASEKAVKKYNLEPKVKIKDVVQVGLDPELMGMGAQLAIDALLKRNNLSIQDIGVFEINEAFAAQTLAVLEELKIPEEKVNIYGGALAIGHPLGMSGTRIVGSLVNAMKNNDCKLGIASVCVGGGQGVGILLENI